MKSSSNDKMICEACGREAHVNIDYENCPHCGFTYRNEFIEIKQEKTDKTMKGNFNGTFE